MATAVFFHAHPDDECIITGGTMVSLAERGHRVVLVTATPGELGEIPAGLLDAGETLAERRAVELEEACRVLGVARQVTLGYRDSGMAGDASNDDPRSFAAADVDRAGEVLAGILREESAEVLVVYDEHGGYGHPDHIQVHRVGMAAADRAATPIVYLSTVNRDEFLRLRDAVAASGDIPGEVDRDGTGEDDAEGPEEMGEPAARITTAVDVLPWIERKQLAMRAHRSQISEESIFLAMPDELFRTVWGREWYIRIRPEPAASGPDHWEAELLIDPTDGAAPDPNEATAGATGVDATSGPASGAATERVVPERQRVVPE